MRIKRFFAALLSIVLTLSVLQANVFAAADIHYLAFASDRHGNTDAIDVSLSGMPSGVEYVCMIGDMVGDKKEKRPEFNSSVVYYEILALGFDKVTGKEETSILWADHDNNVTDDAGIVFSNGGNESGLMYTGKNADGSDAYYIYGIGFYDMKKKDKAKSAAKQFMKWIDTIEDASVPVIVLCHIPLHYSRGDNKGAMVWSKALNYAATGYKTKKDGYEIKRNVIFLHGHNHTSDSKTGKYSGEFYIPVGSKMEVGAKADKWSYIYYTYTTAGYLNQNETATLITISASGIELDKYLTGEVADDVYDTECKKSGEFATNFITSGTNIIDRV